MELELAASQVELTHAVCRLLARLGGNKRPPEQLRIPRPRAPRQPAPAGPKPFDVTTFESYLAQMGA